ncbi:hypothetical protein DENSPDRAFT_749773, partial [Dentipellis sp. KUC8613]
PHLAVHVSQGLLRRFQTGYQRDKSLANKYLAAEQTKDSWYAGQRYFRDDQGLLFFRDANLQPRLCVPEELHRDILIEAHESPFETAHAG